MENRNMSEKDDKAAIVADPPFDDPQADLILRSSDHTDFRVMKCIIALASPAFRDMFSLPQSQCLQNSDLNPPVVSITEPSSILDSLLRILYPVISPELADLDVIEGILEAAEKYDMGVAGDYARRALRARVSRNDAVAIYAIACRFKFEEEARLAARAFLQGSRAHSLVPQMDRLSSTAYYHLLSYHSRFADALPLLLTSVEYAERVLKPTLSHSCTKFKQEMYHSLRNPREETRSTWEWWFYAREAILVELRNAPLAADSFASSTVASCIGKTTCNICKTNALPKWDILKRLTRAFLSDEADEAELILPWKCVHTKFKTQEEMTYT